MAWLKVDDRVRTHPKMAEAGPMASWLWLCGLCYCREHLTDGRIPDAILPSLCPGMNGWKRHAATLERVGLWRRTDTGYEVHSFLEWNPSKADVEAQRASDRARKTPGIQLDSARNPSGIGLESEHTRDAHAGSPSLSDGFRSLEGGAGGNRTAVIMSPAEYDRLLRFNAYVGQRLRVPTKLHSDFMAQLGGPSADADLRVFYAVVDGEITDTGEAIVPNVWKWLTGRFDAWIVARAGDAEMAKFLSGEVS